MIHSPRNSMAVVARVRDDVGVHRHDWATVGTDARGETYRQCRICDARSNAREPRHEALRQDWLNYREDWEPAPEAAPAPPPVASVAEEPVKRKPGRPRKTA